jgi:AraC-like DNA-binding protein
MIETHNLFRDTPNFDRTTREWIVHLQHVPLLGARGIEAVGWVEAHDDYRISRMSGQFDMLYVCLEGQGEVRTEHQWEISRPGTAFLAGAGQPQFYRKIPGVPWRSCWVLSHSPSFLQTTRPYLKSASGMPLLRAIQGLYHETRDQRTPESIEFWVDLILIYSRHIASGKETASTRLQCVWERVLVDLAAPWSVAALANIACLSDESLRRICVAETGYSPMEYVTLLRMQSAASLLVTHAGSVATIAQRVGYNNTMAFTTAFRRVMGCSPRKYGVSPSQ